MQSSNSHRPWAVVTGASTGIGFELAKVFANNGYDLMIVSDESRIHNAADEIRQFGADVQEVQADLSKYEGVEDVYAQIRASGRPVAALALNAGIGAGGDFARETDLAKELRLIDLNVRSTVHLAKRVVKDMLARGEGRLLFTSSIASTMPGTFNAVYNASKAFVQSFAQAIRNELKDTGITVTALMPGATETEFFRRADMEDTNLASPRKRPGPGGARRI